jgi:hypothetical protein
MAKRKTKKASGDDFADRAAAAASGSIPSFEPEGSKRPPPEPEPAEDVPVYRIDLEAFEQDPDNPNAGTIRGDMLVEHSFRHLKAGRSILVDKDNQTIAGNKSLRQAARAGYKKAIVVETDGDEVIIHKRRDMDLDDPTTGARQMSIMDNRTSEVGLNWEADAIAAAVEDGVELGIMFYDDELAKVVGEPLEYHEDDDDKGEDVVPEMEIQPFEHYDYILLVYRSTFDWSRAIDFFDLGREGFTVTKGVRKIGLARIQDGSDHIDRIIQLREHAEEVERALAAARDEISRLESLLNGDQSDNRKDSKEAGE